MEHSAIQRHRNKELILFFQLGSAKLLGGIFFSYLVWICAFAIHCKEEGNPPFYIPEARVGFSLRYEPESAKKTIISEETILEDLADSFCLQAGEENLEARICVSSSDLESVSNLRRSYEAWKKEELIPQFRILLSDGKTANIGTYKKKDLLKKIGNISFGFTGESGVFSNSSGIWDRTRYSRKLHRKGFSFLTYSGTEAVILPSIGSEGIYWLITFHSYHSEGEIRDRFESKNRSLVSECREDLPRVAEIFGETESKIGRWIEIHNPHAFPICEADLEWELLGNRFSFPITIGAISPGETRVYGESSTKPENFLLSGIRWGDLKRVGELKLLRKGEAVSFHLPGGGYVFGEESYSWTKFGFSDCGRVNYSASDSQIYCMDPGIPNQEPQPRDLPFCNVQDFRLEELNPIGLRKEGVLRKDWKYLDLEYSGNFTCDPSFLQVRWGSIFRPISLQNGIEPNSIITLGALPFLLQNLGFVYRDFSGGILGSSVSLQDRKSATEKILWDGEFRTEYGIANRVILEKTNLSVASLSFTEGFIRLHPKMDSETSDPVLNENRRSSPGFLFQGSSDENSSLKFTEVSWMGSYLESEPISKDRFIEIRKEEGDPDSAVLEIESSSGKISILFPIDGKFSLLSSGISTCFPKSEFWKDINFSLPSTGQNILRLYDPRSSSLWDEFHYSSTGPGINDTRNKIRKSASSYLENGVRIWKESAYAGDPFRNPACALTHANPGFAGGTP